MGLKATEHLCFTPVSTLHQLLAGHIEPQVWSAFEDLRDICVAVETGVIRLNDTTAEDEGDSAERFAQLEANVLDLHWQGFGVAGLDGLMESFGGAGIIELVGPKGTGKTVGRLALL